MRKIFRFIHRVIAWRVCQVNAVIRFENACRCYVTDDSKNHAEGTIFCVCVKYGDWCVGSAAVGFDFAAVCWVYFVAF